MINYSVCAPTPCITKAQESRKYLLNDPKIIPRIRSFSKVKDFYLCVCFAVCTPPPSYECLLTHHIFFSVLKLKLTVYLFTHVSNAVRRKRAHVFDAHGLRLILGAWKTLVTFWSLPKSKLQQRVWTPCRHNNNYNEKQNKMSLLSQDMWNKIRVILDIRFKLEIFTRQFVTEILLRYFIELQLS